MNDRLILLINEQATINFGRNIADICKNSAVIYLYGDIGTGKTTFSRGFLQALGYKEKVKSPTYTLVESYTISNIVVHHLDLYRILSLEEIEFIGIREFFSNKAICLVEWPQKGIGMLPIPDIEIYINYHTKNSREAHICAMSHFGDFIVEKFKNLN